MVKLPLIFFYTPPHKPLEGLSVHPSISASFPGSDFSIFWSIFFSLCIGIDIMEECYGIANGMILFGSNRVMALDLCKKNVFSSIWIIGWILLKFCICIDIYKICILVFVNFQQSSGPWLTSEFCLCSISCELTDGFLSNFVHASILIKSR